MPWQPFDDVLSERGLLGAEQRATIRTWNEATFTVECPLPNGAIAFRTYWRAGGAACGGIQLPYRDDDSLAAAVEARALGRQTGV